MKKLNKLFTVLTSIFLIAAFVSCNSQFNEDVMFNTVGAKLKTTSPGEVINLSVTPGDCSATLNWENPGDIDLFGITIYVTCNDSEVALPDPVTLSSKVSSQIPTKYTFYGLTNDKSYTFTCRTFNTNLVYSPGWGLATTPTTNLSNYHVSNLKVIGNDSCVHISWSNETIEENKTPTIMPDLEGVLITYSEITYINNPSGNEDPENGENNSTQEIKYTNTKSITLQKTNGIVPTEYTIYELKNGTNYAFSVKQFDKKLNYSTPTTSSTSPKEKTNTLKVTNTKATKNDSSISLAWTNPTSEKFYGLKIEANPAEGNLNVPVYFMDSDKSRIPTGFEVTGLRNNVTYDFTITAIDNEMYLSSTSASVSETPTPTSNNIEISGLTAMTSTGCVTLYWKKPADISTLKEYELTVSPYLRKVSLDDINVETYAFTELENGTSYSFTIRTVDINSNRSEGISVEAIPNTGSSGIFNSPDLITYKKDKKAYDFGYCSTEVTKTFDFISSSEMDLSQTKISKVMGKDNAFYDIKFKNLTNPGNNTVNITDEFSITVKYKPDTNNPSWDEADILIGGKSQNAIRLIGSSYKQPKNVAENNLQIWLRADMIKETDLSNNAIKTVPDYSGKNNHANCPDTTYELAPRYEETWQNLNNLPAINFNADGKTKSQLLILGKDGKPVIQTKEGITCFIVFYMNNPHSGQGLISTNYGTSFPTLVSHARYFNKTGFWIKDDYKTGLAVKGNGLSGGWRWPCINTSTNDENNHMLIFGSPTTASDISNYDNIATNTLSVCTVFDQKKSNLKNNDNGDFPSNIRMFVNNDERLLGYIWSNDSNYSKQKLNDSLLSSDGLTTNGSYGMPWGDGKGHRYGSLTDVVKPSSIDSTDYETWKTQAATGNNLGSRKFDRAYNINSSASNSSYTTSANSDRDYFENWILNDTWRNGTINILTIGADSITSTYCYSQIAEIIIYDRKLEDDEISIVNNYIKQRYNIQKISTNSEDYIKK